MKVLVGSPSRRTEESVEPHASVLQWTWDDNGRNYLRFMLATPQGADAARSQIIEAAKEWGAQVLVMVDMDITAAKPQPYPGGVLRGLPFPDGLSFARQAFSRGYAMVVSPTVSFSGSLLVWPVEGEKYEKPEDIPTGLSEIGWAGLGLAYFDGEYLGKLQVLDRKKDIGGPKDGLPMYCLQTPQVGEDNSLCHNVRYSTGRKVGVDTRLSTDHWKLQKKRSFPGGELAQEIRQNLARAQQGSGAG